MGDLSLDELIAIDHILISHSHLDHVLSIGLADSVMRNRGDARRSRCALPATIDALRTHIFNGVICWPDAARLPAGQAPLLKLNPFEVGQTIARRTPHRGAAGRTHGAAVRFCRAGCASRQTRPLHHSPVAARTRPYRTVGAPARHAHRRTGDRGRHSAARKAPWHASARHLCPSVLRPGAWRLDHPTSVYITHVKPGEVRRA